MSDEEIIYRFDKHKDATWNSYERHQARYKAIEHLLPCNGYGAEIGVYKGGFGEFLRMKAKRLYLVDPWYRHTTFWNESRTDEMSAVAALIKILTVYKQEIENERVVVIVDYGVNFLEGCQENYFDWVYLDASHKYDQTLAEIEAAYRCIKPGGYLIGDDYEPDPMSKQHGVYKAVNDFMYRKGIAALALNETRQWAIKVDK